MKFYLTIALFVTTCVIKAQNVATTQTPINETYLIKNADFETGTMDGWKHWRTKFSSVVKEPFSGNYAVRVGPERAFCNQEFSESHQIKYLSLYLLFLIVFLL